MFSKVVEGCNAIHWKLATPSHSAPNRWSVIATLSATVLQTREPRHKFGELLDMNENQTTLAIVEEFEARRGLTLLGYTQDKQHGFDAAFQDDDGHIWAFEVKGIGPSNAAREKYFDDGYARLPQIESGRKTLRDRQGNLTKTIPHYVSLAIPHHDHYVYHSRFFTHAFKRLGYGLYVVHTNRVEEVVQPRLISK